MKIVYICPTSTMYGDNIALINMMPFLIKNGVKPFFVLPHKNQYDLQNVLKKLGYKYKSYDLIYPSMWKGCLGFLKSFIKYLLLKSKDYKLMLNDIKDFGPDIIHTNTSGCTIGYYVSRELKVNHLWHIREYMDLDAGFHHFPTKYSFQRKIQSKLNYSICITEDIYKHFKNPLKSRIVYDGVFETKNIPKINNNDGNYFLFVGRLIPEKGIEIVIKAFIQYSKKNNLKTKLKIAGTGDANYTEKLKRIAKLSSEESLIEFLGYRKDVYELMSNAKALIVASRCEAFGFITAEAMFCGCPVIGHNTGGTKIQFDNGLKLKGKEIGFRYQTEEELEQCMNDLTNNRAKISPMLVDAQDSVVQLYSIENNANIVFQYYQDIMD